jgi:hypothetical protein
VRQRARQLGGLALAGLTAASMSGPALATPTGYSIGLNFGANQGNSTLAATDVAGVASVAQRNWNNLSDGSGFNPEAIVADNNNNAAPNINIGVEWTSNNTWASTGAGEENNGFTGADRILMTGYLDTGNATTSEVTISGLPTQLTANSYDVYVYTLGGVAGRGGALAVLNPLDDSVIRDYMLVESPANPSTYVEDTGADRTQSGTYVVFKGLTLPSIKVVGTTADGRGFSGTPRAPINAIQLVAASEIRPVVGPVNSNPQGITLRVDDVATTVVTGATAVLNGEAVTLTRVKDGAVTTLSYDQFVTKGQFLASGSTNELTLVITDSGGRNYTENRTFVVAPYVTVNPANAVTGVNTAQRGFNIRMHQVASGQPNTVLRAERQLRGDLGENVASLVDIVEEGVINYNQDAPSNAGFFNFDNGFEDQPIPGIPGTTGSTDNIAAEITTILEFDQPGAYTLIFNSDDGFRTSLSRNPREQLNNQLLSQFDGGRGASDTAVTIVVPTAGFYPVRSVWFEGGGGANLEWAVQRVGRARALINDNSANSIRAFRSTSAATPAGVVFVSPGRETANPYLADESIVVDIANPSNGTVTPGSIVLKLNDAVVVPQVTTAGSITTLRYTPPAALASGSTAKVEVAFADSTGGNYMGSYTYTVAAYSSIPLSMRMPDSAVNKTLPGFLFKTVQSDQGLENRVRRADLHTRGLLGLPNVAELFGSAANGYFQITGVINFDQGPGNAGVFNGNNGFPEDPIPGIPGTLGGTDNISAEILTVIEFPTAGLYTFSFNSDDGFATWFGHPNDNARILAGQFDGGRGASDTFYSVFIPQAGLYPVRTVWFEGGGGANLEWYIRRNGVNTLLNDTANGGVKTYQYPLGVGPAWVKHLVPSQGVNRVDPTAPIRAVIADGTGSVDVGSVSLKVNDVVVPATIARSGSEITVHYVPSLTPNAAHSVELVFADRVVRRTFNTGALTGVAFFIEAEDFNFNGGQSDPSASDMNTYRGGAYAGRAAVAEVDYSRPHEGSSPWYRIDEDPNVPMDVNNAEGWGRGITDLQINFKLGWIGGGQWYNYTRNIPAGRYNVYAGLSHGESNPGQLSGTLQKVTAGATTADQTLEQLGTFTGQGTGGWGVNRLVPLQDAEGQNVALELGGTTTLRYSSNSGDFDYLLLVNVPTERPEFTRMVLNPNGTVTIEWTGGGTLQAGPSITGPWSDVAGATSPFTLTPDPAVGQLFGRIRK